MKKDDLFTIFMAGMCFGALIGMFLMAIIRSFFW